MSCCQCQGIENMFDKKAAKRELKRYLKKGPTKTTKILLDEINKIGVEGLTFLDIGGGIGAIQNALINSGAIKGISVEASSAYIDLIKDEIGLNKKIVYTNGDFTKIASSLDAADIVTLDKVICCYDDMDALVGSSSKLAQKIYAIVYPRDNWWTKLLLPIINLYPKIKGSSFRVFIHPTKQVEDIIIRNGLKRNYYNKRLFWQVAIFTR